MKYKPARPGQWAKKVWAAQEKFDGRDIYLAGHTITPRAICFQDLVPNISGAEHYLQDLARKFGESAASDDGDDSERWRRRWRQRWRWQAQAPAPFAVAITRLSQFS
jgi:hypothetical protein